MRYRNKKTGAVIDIKSTLRGENWEALGSPSKVKDDAPAQEKEEPKKAGKKK